VINLIKQSYIAYPISAKYSAIPAPMPVLDPVMITTLSDNMLLPRKDFVLETQTVF